MDQLFALIGEAISAGAGWVWDYWRHLFRLSDSAAGQGEERPADPPQDSHQAQPPQGHHRSPQSDHVQSPSTAVLPPSWMGRRVRRGTDQATPLVRCPCAPSAASAVMARDDHGNPRGRLRGRSGAAAAV